MKPEVQALRTLLGASQRKGHTSYVVPKLAGFSKTEVDLICEMGERGIYELLSFCFCLAYCGNQPRPPGVFIRKPLTEKHLRIAMRRFVAVAWLLHSEMLVGAETNEHGEPIPLTLEQLGKIPQIGCTKVALSLLAKRFGDQFNLHTRIQKRKGSRENYAAAAKTGWNKRRAREKQSTCPKRRKK